MPRLCRNALSAAMGRTAAPGSYADSNGLMLRVKARGTRQWVQRLTIHGRRVDLGLGSAELVSLANARRTAADNRAVARTGGDPRRARVPSFARAEEACFAERGETWRTESPARNWRLAMEKYVLPKRAAEPRHHDALHFSDVGAALAKIDATRCAPSTKRAIRFTALTAARQIEVRRAAGSSSTSRRRCG